MPWDPVHRELALTLWKTGCGSARIIEALAAAGKPTTKNAVVCVAYRAGLAFQGARQVTRPQVAKPARVPLTPEERAERERARAARRRERDAAAAGRPVTPPRPRVQPAGVPVSLAVLLTDVRDGQCRYIADDPRAGPATCCGHQVMPGSSWCPGHRAICAAPAQRPASTFVRFRRVA